MNMKQWVADQIALPKKKALPILSFPSVQLLGVNVRELVTNSEAQARGMKAIADRTDAAAAVSLMDLSIEAEAFGATIHISDDEVPTVTGALVTDEDEADALQVPAVGAGRTGNYIEAIRMAKDMITDRPVFAGVIGPYSLAGRLLDVNEALVLCYVEPDMVHTVLKKATEFLIQYILAYKEAGAHGVVMAEPLSGLLSPELEAEFSGAYVKQIVDAVQDDEFILIYHNCGNHTVRMTESLAANGSACYHFGNIIRMADILPKMPGNVLVMGNVDPAGQIREGTPESIREATFAVMEECCGYPNFCISTGCDIPPHSPWENIDAFFQAVEEFYAAH